MATGDDFYCEVLAGARAVDALPGTERVAAHFHTNPVAPFHAVVYPRAHVASLLAVRAADLLSEIFQVIRGLIEQYGLQEEAFRVVTNGGAYQESQHLHFHVLSPRARESAPEGWSDEENSGMSPKGS
jgi:histidine triad (HIT) family protein